MRTRRRSNWPTASRTRPRRPEQGLLLHRWRRGGRDRLQARQALLEAAGKARQAQGHLARVAYHGTPQGALAITGIPAMKSMFEPSPPAASACRTPTSTARPEMGGPADDLEAFGRWAADRIEEMILFEGADTVAAVFLEPVQNSGGCFPPPPGYFARCARDLRPPRTCCSSRTRSSAPSAASVTRSRARAWATCPT